ncbi:hypothetical protein BT96DRAFT_915333 [Gymnopus androsaceus JB14]|uniref:Uncharacterized protein n=1 Tax=Gymnopus androsaceus JB14 TaxID=1447944 RepID=A0A6A4I3C8_9AGAR|nr:hypothetical protein BT96DRAFT_915333 [Gymnopus androsaceus JB14]
MELFRIIEISPSLCEVTYRPGNFSGRTILLGHLISVVLGNNPFRTENPAKRSAHWPTYYTWRDVELCDLGFVRKPTVNTLPKYSLISLSLEQRRFSMSDQMDDLSAILYGMPSEPGLENMEELCAGVAIQLRRNLWDIHKYMLVLLSKFSQNVYSRPLPVALETSRGQNAHKEYRLFKLDMLEFLGLPQEEELDLSTEVMPIWEERHEEEFAVAVRYMAKLCPSLQEFVWYFGGVEQEYKLDSWRWKIHRNKDGSLNQVSGKLFWPESCRPPFPSFREFALVGEERRRAEEHGWPRTAFSEQFSDPRT